MTERSSSKGLPTIGGKETTKKEYIRQYTLNNPCAIAAEIAEKADTTPNYVWKVLSQARKPSKGVRGREGRIFVHGKVYYEEHVLPSSVASLSAPIVNPKTGMKQIGCISKGNPCSCQIHPNGHLIVWSHSIGWQKWLVEELTAFSWTREFAQFIVENLKINVVVAECGLKPVNPLFLPKDFRLETDWGVVVVRDDSPEKGVLELKLSIPDLSNYLGLPRIKKILEIIEQGSLTHNQSHKAIEALLISLCRILERQNRLPDDNPGG